MNIDERYQQIVDKLKQGHRYLAPLTPQEILWLTDRLKEATGSELTKILCIVENTSTQAKEFVEPLMSLLKRNDLTPEALIYALNAARKHIIARSLKVGERFDSSFLDVLASLLKHKNTEVVEWVLRTIDEIGPQAVIFKDQIAELRPKIISQLLNSHKRTVGQLVQMFDNKFRGRHG